jgi:hypothetical protein
MRKKEEEDSLGNNYYLAMKVIDASKFTYIY